MKILVRLIAIALFIVFFDFALKNTDEVVLHLFWNAQAKTPLILLLLGFLLVGVVIGVLAMTGTLLRYRRDLARHRSEIEHLLDTSQGATDLVDRLAQVFSHGRKPNCPSGRASPAGGSHRPGDHADAPAAHRRQRAE